MAPGAEHAEIILGLHSYTPLSHLARSWAALDHLGHIECNNTN